MDVYQRKNHLSLEEAWLLLFFIIIFCYYSLETEAMQHAGSVSLSKNVNTHCCNRNSRIQRKVNSSEQQYRYSCFNICFCIFVFILLACAPFTPVYRTASFTRLPAYCGLCTNLFCAFLSFIKSGYTLFPSFLCIYES